ncbi:MULTISPECIES: protein kinase domain-containing protein [Streptomyces]|uniref:non-specific serine/threonine protein kinase n=3 Tax=Streptomyces TaxID=1883 RepID=A0ABQ3NU89_STRVG|nr:MULTISPECIES: protein kinase [Streptomyces]KOU27090.1 serine/threonine protein kinase [Streptomyces sp. WM6349]KOU94887.1 serine/threonine protein kinase [Streptomyces sp. XY593]KOV09063.1 serine/threonine protein kinase [Streptomyces sp. XY533]KOV17719.1 serine/threonine protein kinase [Streptomyces sp. XY511]KOV55262.1 serine/threonine protein kinase [Streptomyces sp. H036]
MSQDGTQGQYAGGSLAGGRYQLRDLLGAGGMASVYLAYDSALDRQVAIKTLHSDLGREQSFRERFRREAQAVAKLSHTNIVSVFDTGEGEVSFGGGRSGDGAVMPYIVMEYVEGKPLGSVLEADIRQYGAMPADKALKVTADVLAALETSHEMGLVHRDIKPGNVMVNKRGVVKVMDFGIARAMQSGVTSMTQTGMVVGTPQYLSPEQALGRGVDARSDLYSVGIMLFQLLTGRIPFDADSPLAIAYAHVQEEPVAPSSINRSVTPAMDALVARALKKNPNERFPTAAAMGDEVARVLGSGQTGAPVIVQGQGPLSSGAGVSSAVFPPVDSGFQAPPQSVQQPYQAPHNPTPAPYAPTPAPQPHAQGGYAYPHTPPPQAQYAPQTPPPYTISPTGTASPSGSGGDGKRNMPVVVGAIAVALLAVGGLIAAISMNGDDKDKGGTTADPGASTSASAKAGFKGPDVTRTIDPKKCSEPTKHYSEAGKYSAPDLKYKNLLSVKECIQASGGKYTIVPKDEAVYGKDTVLSQSPAAGDKINKEGVEYTLTVSTGNPE